LREQLLVILLDSRFRLVSALASPQVEDQPDPVRLLFLDNWKRLRDAIRGAARRGTLGSRALEFLSFISAGDALFALDEAAPALGMRISADDLRQLARIMAPKATGDPLEYNFDEDPELREIFKVPKPPESGGVEANLENPIEPTPTATATPSPSPSPAPSPAATSLLDKLIDAMTPLEAAAAPPKTSARDPDSRAKALAQKLRRTVVDENNVHDYEPAMRQLLELSARRELVRSPHQAALSPMFVALVKSTAWQESCWRQFIRVGNQVRWLESSTGDIGVMQVNKYVWRGLYNLDSLKWDVLYNAGAGTEILMRMLRYAMEKRGGAPGRDLDGLARSAYAAFNGGPEAYNRWRRFKPGPARRIDAAFWKKYAALRDGYSLDILACAATRDTRAAN
jgi:hypothetical protein